MRLRGQSTRDLPDRDWSCMSWNAAGGPDLFPVAVEQLDFRAAGLRGIENKGALNFILVVDQDKALSPYFFRRTKLRLHRLRPRVMGKDSAKKAGGDRECQIEVLHGRFLLT